MPIEKIITRLKQSFFDMLMEKVPRENPSSLYEEVLRILVDSCTLEGAFLVYEGYKYIVTSEEVAWNEEHSIVKNVQKVPDDQTIFSFQESGREIAVFQFPFLSLKELYLGIVYRENTLPPEFSPLLWITCAQFLEYVDKEIEKEYERARYAGLYDLTMKLYSSLDPNQVLKDVITALDTICPKAECSLILSHDSEVSHDPSIRTMKYNDQKLSSGVMKAYVSGRIHIEMMEDGKRSVLYAPLQGKQGVYGVLEMIGENGVICSEQEMSFIEKFAHTTGAALENAKLHEQLEQVIEDVKLINETSHKLNSSLRLDDTIHYMTEQIITFFHAKGVGFLLCITNDKYKILEGSTELFFQTENKAYIDKIYKKINREKESKFINDTDTLFGEKFPYRSLIALPMIHNNKMSGLVLIVHDKPYFFTFNHYRVLQSLVHHSTLAFTNSILREELESLVVTDHLTKLYSRSYLDEQIQKSIEQDKLGSLLLLDIDNFKQVNDTYGHQTGDQVLIQVSSIIKNNLRDGDIGARWGGEELAVYLPNVPQHIAVSIAQRLVAKVHKETVPHTTVSCGVSSWKRGEKSAHRLFIKADKALYQAKNNGKNQVVKSCEK
ncbi:sensor domain-containing diguanylate cyclase [Priestia filamentosa]|uniref:sensor domain-containing diguanylate cyclase n=1 Tax=Priestia filamentosa TaxID=1402861 RepID=UPI003D2B3171